MQHNPSIENMGHLSAEVFCKLRRLVHNARGGYRTFFVVALSFTKVSRTWAAPSSQRQDRDTTIKDSTIFSLIGDLAFDSLASTIL